MKKNVLTKSTLVLSILGITINILLVWLTKIFPMPLYLDSVGTVLVAALGGALPGIAVGFFTNCITSLTSVSPDPMTLYYGFISVLIAAMTSWISKKGILLKWYGFLMEVFSCAAFGGILGSAMTWILYGFSFGQGISAPFSTQLHYRFGFPKYLAQLTADSAIDVADKLVTILILYTILHFLPKWLLEKLPLGYIYTSSDMPNAKEAYDKAEEKQHSKQLAYRKISLNSKITALILISSFLLCVTAVTIGTFTYRDKMITQYSEICESAVDLMVPSIDGNKISTFLSKGESAGGYAQTLHSLNNIFQYAKDIDYMYVYQIQPDGCHVVFDLSTNALPGEPVGTVIPFDDSFPYLDEVISGEEIPPLITDDTYGWLLTVYKPIKNVDKKVVAYAAADINMESISISTYTYFMNIASLLFGIMILIAMVSIWYCNRYLLQPMNILAKQAHDFDFEGSHKGNRVRDRYDITTGDELEEVFHAMCRTEDTIADHVAQLNAKNLEISHMQRNIIYTLANMVENRDSNTGGHIKRTAYYVRLIGNKLKQAGIYTDIIDDAYIKRLFDSAPLHDIGKIKVSDSILNKPGKLTPDEFEIMKTHTTEGRNILHSSLSNIEDSSWLSMALDMAMYHHEKWDGSGYPCGLCGEDIPLCARIMAISDVFDALVSKRSYKPAFSLEEAMTIVKESAGSHFDPKIVMIFINAEAEILKIMEYE